MSTALALVNRMRAKRRDATSTVITDRQGVAYLDALNSAATTVLEERTWDFQKRSDGRLITVPTFTGNTLLMTPGSVAVFAQSWTGTEDQLFGNFVTRLVALGDELFGDTGVRLDNASLSGDIMLGTLADEWSGGNTFSGFRTYVYEYLLPDTVREVTSVRNQETGVPLTFSTSLEDFEAAFPRPHDLFSTDPQVACVSGEVENTVSTAIGVNTTGLCIRLWPVPEDQFSLDYSYIYRQPRLLVAEDEFDRVPPAVEDLIVDLAIARVIMEIEKDLQVGLALEAKLLKQMTALHRNHDPSAGKRPELLSHDQTSRPGNPLMWLPRQVEGLSGS